MIKKYSGTLTGEPVMLHETRIVAKMLLEGYSKEYVKKDILENNPFGYKTKKSIPKRLSAIFRRLNHLNEEMLHIIVDDLSGDGKLVVLYGIYLEDRLFNELISEDIVYKFLIRDFEYNKPNILKFINDKSELDEKLGSFTEYTKYRLSVSLFNILNECGIIELKNKKPHLKAPVISLSLKDIFEKRNDIKFLTYLGMLK